MMDTVNENSFMLKQIQLIKIKRRLVWNQKNDRLLWEEEEEDEITTEGKANINVSPTAVVGSQGIRYDCQWTTTSTSR